MSILLEALKQKNNSEKSSVKTPVVSALVPKVVPETNSSLSEPLLAQLNSSDVTRASLEPMDELVTQLAIQVPEGLNWQLSALAQHEPTNKALPAAKLELAVTTAPTFPPLAFDLILPKPEDNDSSHAQPVNEISAAAPLADTSERHQDEIFQPQLIAEPTQQPIVDSDTSLELDLHSVTASILPHSLSATPEAPEISPSNASDHKVKSATLADQAITSIKLPDVDKSPLSAQRFLSFARRLKPTHKTAQETEKAPVQLSAQVHKPSKQQARQPLIIAGGILVGFGVLGYATLTIWEAQQQAHLQQMARYKNQSLAELPERPVINAALSPTTADAALGVTVAPITNPTSTSGPVDKLATPPLTEVSVKRAEAQTQGVNIQTKPPIESESKTNLRILDTNRRSPQSDTVDGETLQLRQTQPTAEWLMMAYNAWQAGNWSQAEYYYRQVLEKQPSQKDALMGMLAVVQLNGSPLGLARDYAEQLRRLYPNDREVRLATDGILVGVSGERLSESELKQGRQNASNTSEISFRLGLLYAEQQRWPEAQSAFFEAVKSSPANSDYRLNLAVSYDHLGKHRLAVEHYQQLLRLAKTASGKSVDTDMIEQRLAYLAPLVIQEP